MLPWIHDSMIFDSQPHSSKCFIISVLSVLLGGLALIWVVLGNSWVLRNSRVYEFTESQFTGHELSEPQFMSPRVLGSICLWFMSIRVSHHIWVCLYSTLCDACRILHTISEGVLTRLLALCIVLSVCQNLRAETAGLPLHESAALLLLDSMNLRVHEFAEP